MLFVLSKFGGAVVRTSTFPLRSWVRFSLRTREKRVCQLRSAESRGFSSGTPVSSHGKLRGWVRINLVRKVISE